MFFSKAGKNAMMNFFNPKIVFAVLKARKRPENL
jgi:hypothetical protein